MAMRSWTVSYLRLAIPPEGPGGEGDLVVLVAEQQVQLHSPHRLPSFLHRLDFDDAPKDFPDNFIVVLLNEITKWFKEEKCRMKIELSSIVYNYFRHRSYHYELSSFLYIIYYGITIGGVSQTNLFFVALLCVLLQRNQTYPHWVLQKLQILPSSRQHQWTLYLARGSNLKISNFSL